MNELCEKNHHFLQYLFVLTLILECNSIYSQLYGYHLMIRGIIIMISVICMIFMLLDRKVKIYKTILKIIVFVLFCSSFIFFNTDNSNGKMIIILIFTIFLPISLIFFSNITKKEFKQILNKFVDIVIFLSILSCLFWLFSAIIPLIKPNTSLKVVWANPYSTFESFYYIHFNTQTIYWITDTPIIRNTGIFTEGPMYSVILVIALIFNNLIFFENTNKNLKRTIIIFMTLISTMSTTGIVCAIIIMIYNYKKNLLIMNKITKLIFLGLSLFLVFVSVPVGVNLLEKKMTTGSAIHRNMDLKNGLKTFLSNPILGNGINHERENESNYERGYGYSNTIIPILTDGGILLGAIYLIPVISLGFKSLVKKKYNYLMLLAVYMIIMLTTLIQYRLVMMILITILTVLQYENKLYLNDKINYD